MGGLALGINRRASTTLFTTVNNGANTIDQIAALRTFVRIVETGSFTQAAASLGTPKPTVTKLVQQLEAHLRTKLLSRTTRRLAVTSDGAAYYERAIRVLADLDELEHNRIKFGCIRRV